MSEYDGSWSVFNSGGACIIEDVKYAVAADYMTEDRFKRGWTMVSVIKSMDDLAAPTPPVDAVPGEPAVPKYRIGAPPRDNPLPEGWLDDYITSGETKLNRYEMPGVYFVQGVRFAEAHYASRLAASVAPRAGSEPVAFMWQHDETGRTGFVAADFDRAHWEHRNPRLHIVSPLYAIAPAAAAEPSESPWFGVEDEVSLTRAVSVMNDVLTDISGWEDRALAEAIESSKVDLCAMIECIRMRADDSYVPGSKPIDGEAVPIIPDRERAASLVASEDTKRLDYLQQTGSTVELVPGGHGGLFFRIGGLYRAVHAEIRQAIDAARTSAGEAQS
jgi:hypothetical protein